LKKQSSSSRKS